MTNGYLNDRLAEFDKMYNHEVCMLKSKFSSPGYHTSLIGKGVEYVHRTRESIQYATLLLNSGEENNIKRAHDIIRKVISYQDTNENNKTCGIWQWFMEEPLQQMCPPDWNWADFCGSELLCMLKDHKKDIPQDIIKLMENSLSLAIKSIVRRDVSITYTNIAILGSYVSIVGGHLLNNDEFIKFGKSKFIQLFSLVKKVGAYNEYNSPTYTIVGIQDLKRLIRHVEDSEIKRMAEELYFIAWESIAKHFHKTTGELAGPHLRSYSSLGRSDFVSILNFATDGLVQMPSYLTYRPSCHFIMYDIKCPDELLHYFDDIKEERIIDQIFNIDEDKGIIEKAYSYITPEYSMGSINEMDLWNQRRSLIMYFGSNEKPIYIALRMLHDGFDFASGTLHSMQCKNKLIGAVNTVSNGGDTHVNIDITKNATITAKQLSVVLEIGGALEDVEIMQDFIDGKAVIKCCDNTVKIKMPYIIFGDETVKPSIERTDNTINLTANLYNGEEKEINLDKTDITCVFAIVVDDNLDDVEVTQDASAVFAKMGNLSVPCLKKGQRLSGRKQ